MPLPLLRRWAVSVALPVPGGKSTVPPCALGRDREERYITPKLPCPCQAKCQNAKASHRAEMREQRTGSPPASSHFRKAKKAGQAVS